MSMLPRAAEPAPNAQAPGFREAAGLALPVWAAAALLQFAAQIAFRRNLEPGDFATLNSVLGAIGLAAVPLAALRLGLTFSRADTSSPAEARLPIQQTALVIWGFVCALAFLPLLDLLRLPRFSVGLFATAALFVALGACFGAARYQHLSRWKSWAALVLLAGAARVLGAIFIAGAEPWAEMGLLVEILAGSFLLAPILRQSKMTFAWNQARTALKERDLKLHLAATISLLLGLYLFTNADRFLAQIWFGNSTDNNLGLVRWDLFDGYQTAGLLGRALVWGTQPILLLFLARRSPQDHTGKKARRYLWLYLAALLLGGFVLYALRQPLSRLFGGGGEEMTEYFLPGFIGAMVMMGLVQGLGFFALASRRYPECFALGAAGIAYTVFLALVGRPQLLVSYMFGGGGVALLLVLSIGIVRWGRQQP
jgi:hypothetical protein